MGSKARLTGQQLRGLLRAGDPAVAETALTEAERLAMRERLAQEEPLRPLPGPRVRWQPAVLGAATVLLVLAAGIGLGRRGAAPPVGPIPAPQADGAVSARPAPIAAEGQRQQIRMTTSGGTRIVWTMNPGLRLR